MIFTEESGLPEIACPIHRRRDGRSHLLTRIGILSALCSAVMLAPVSTSAQDQEQPKELLQRVRRNVVDTVTRLPKYVCTQTIDRYRYEPENGPEQPRLKNRRRSCDDIVAKLHGAGWKRRLVSSDRLRVEVAVSHVTPGITDEMYSWPGEERFSERSLFQLVRDGALSTGSFSAMVTTILASNAARFSYHGDTSSGGRALAEFGFRVAKESSKYTYVYGTNPEQETAIAYGGTVLVDANTGDPVRMVVRTGALPPETGACELTQSLDYERVRLQDQDFLLPTEARATVIHTDETEAENRIHYTGCREFHGEATVTYEADRRAEAYAQTGVEERPSPVLPAGLPFKVVFTERINPVTAAAGDLLRGRLKRAIRDSKAKVIVPESAPVTGRIVRLRRFYDQHSISNARRGSANGPSLVVDVRLETLEFEGKALPLRAAVESGAPRPVKQTGPLTLRVDIGTLERAADRSLDSDIATFEFWESPERAARNGLESNWVTLASNHEN